MIVQIIQNSYSLFSKTEKKIADFILNNRQQCITLNSIKMAKSIGVSQSSIINLIKKLEFKGFTEFKLRLGEDLALSRSFPIHTEILLEDSLQDVAEKIISENTKSMHDTLRSIDYQITQEVINKLHLADEIIVVGFGTSVVSAQYFTRKLIKIGKKAIYTEDKLLRLLGLGSLSSNSAVVAISHTGNSPEIIEFAQKVIQEQLPLISISSIGQNQLKDLGGFILSIVSYEGQIQASSISSVTAIMLILDILFMGILQQDYEKYQLSMQKSRYLAGYNIDLGTPLE